MASLPWKNLKFYTTCLKLTFIYYQNITLKILLMLPRGNGLILPSKKFTLHLVKWRVNNQGNIW